jgi:hypothetical protein
VLVTGDGMSPKATHLITNSKKKRTWQHDENGRFKTPSNKSMKTSSKKSTKSLQIVGTSMNIQQSTKKTLESQETKRRESSVRIAGMNEREKKNETCAPVTATDRAVQEWNNVQNYDSRYDRILKHAGCEKALMTNVQLLQEEQQHERKSKYVRDAMSGCRHARRIIEADL